MLTQKTPLSIMFLNCSSMSESFNCGVSVMKYELKTKTELIAELKELRNRLEDLKEVQTAKRMAEEAVEELLETLGLIVHGIPSGLFIYQYEAPGGLKLLNGNPAAVRLTGIKMEDWKGRGLTQEWVDANGQGLTDHLLNAVKTGKTFEDERVAFRGSDTHKFFQMRAFAMPQDRLGISFQDVTQLGSLEQSLALASQQLEELSGKTEQYELQIEELRAGSTRNEKIIDELREKERRT